MREIHILGRAENQCCVLLGSYVGSIVDALEDMPLWRCNCKGASAQTIINDIPICRSGGSPEVGGPEKIDLSCHTLPLFPIRER